jgi:predicted GNAT family acetyltransferase
MTAFSPSSGPGRARTSCPTSGTPSPRAPRERSHSSTDPEQLPSTRGCRPHGAHSPEESRYEIRDGDRVLGLAAYRRRGDTTVFTHTEVDPDAGQDGLGSTLVRAALDDVRSRGGSVVPRCSFVRGWIERHPEYADLVTGTVP